MSIEFQCAACKKWVHGDQWSDSFCIDCWRDKTSDRARKLQLQCIDEDDGRLQAGPTTPDQVALRVWERLNAQIDRTRGMPESPGPHPGFVPAGEALTEEETQLYSALCRRFTSIAQSRGASATFEDWWIQQALCKVAGGGSGMVLGNIQVDKDIVRELWERIVRSL